MSYKENLQSLDVDSSASVSQAYNTAKQQLQQVHTANLEGADRVLPTEYNEELDSLYTQFSQEKPKKLEAIQPKREALKKKNLIFLLIQIALIIVGVVVIFQGNDAAVFGWVLLIAGIVCHFVFKSILEKESGALSQEWSSFFINYIDSFGHPETLHSPATGIYKQVDDLFLTSLDVTARGFEMQNRATKKQMEAQNEMHQEAMIAQQKQIETMQKGLDNIANEQHRTNRALFGR
jgi:hypothetical protein